jgi:hypothetical protein
MFRAWLAVGLGTLAVLWGVGLLVVAANNADREPDTVGDFGEPHVDTSKSGELVAPGVLLLLVGGGGLTGGVVVLRRDRQRGGSRR